MSLKQCDARLDNHTWTHQAIKRQAVMPLISTQLKSTQLNSRVNEPRVHVRASSQTRPCAACLGAQSSVQCDQIETTSCALQTQVPVHCIRYMAQKCRSSRFVNMLMPGSPCGHVDFCAVHSYSKSNGPRSKPASVSWVISAQVHSEQKHPSSIVHKRILSAFSALSRLARIL